MSIDPILSWKMAEPQYNEAVEALRDLEYPMLKDSIYLDHAGTTLPSKSLMESFAADMTSALYGNPHSASLSAQLSAARIDDIRLRLLRFFKADPAQYDLVFVANATAGVKLVLEGMRSLPYGYSFAYHEACHTSLVGVREEARQNVCLDDTGVQSWLGGKSPFMPAAPRTSATLFAYTAQSHMDGRRYPLSWSEGIKKQSTNASSSSSSSSSSIFTLLDVASLAATSQLDLSSPSFAADFIVLSLYKIFGFPDLGLLIVRRSAESVWDSRRYFGGGTVDMVLCGKEQCHVPKTQTLHERLEDGTLPFHNILAVDAALNTHSKLFGSMDQISSHTYFLCHQLSHELGQLRHGNGNPVCVLYTELQNSQSSPGAGPVLSFNLKDSRGFWFGLAEFEKLAIVKNIHIRTGGLCSPAGIASTLDLQPWEMRRNLSAGFRCGEDTMTSTLKPTGVIRASLGATSTKSDVNLFIRFIKEFFVEEDPGPQLDSPSCSPCLPTSSLRVKSITVFPIKSCGGFQIPAGVCWEVRAEGLAWDREWCLVHRGSGQVLSQKRYPKMALLRPYLVVEENVLKVKFSGETTSKVSEVEIPLKIEAPLGSSFCQMPSRVCGENIHAQAYTSEDINNFFSEALEVPCVLARFPSGGRGSSSRSSRARMRKHQKPETFRPLFPGPFPGMPSPPDSDSEQQQQQQQKPNGNILLSNESPILMIHAASVSKLNQEIKDTGGDAVSDSAFRANIVIENQPGHAAHPAYSEDFWKTIRIGSEDFTLLGACQRCQMVCVDQQTGERKQEPLSTLAKTRRLDSKVYFGVHMQLDHDGARDVTDSTRPLIRVGDAVIVQSANG